MREAALQAVRRYAAMDADTWNTGLSAPGARRALREACALVLGSRLQHAELHPGLRPPRELLIWCAGNVFTAPLEWVALFRAMGARVTLKAPSGEAAPLHALADAFGPGVRVVEADHAAALPLIDAADAVIGFGSDAAMQTVYSRLSPEKPRSLHGHRVSFAVIDHPDSAPGLALDAALYDGRGCMSPAAVFCTGDADRLCEALAGAMAEAERELPRGLLHPAEGVEFRRRVGQARVQGRVWGGERWAVCQLPLAQLEAAAPPRLLTVHKIDRPEDLAPLRALPLSSCGTDRHDGATLSALGFWRICRPGHMQLPPAGRPHDGVDLRTALCRAVSLESR